MTAQSQNTPTPESQKQSDKELNFRMLEAKYEKQLAQERQARMHAEQENLRLSQQRQAPQEEEEDSEPYVDHKKLNKTLARFGETAKKEMHSEIHKAVQEARQDERKQNWLKNNPDFYDVLQNADKFAAKDPDLAETILEMPEGFERQKLVYNNIKALGLHRPEVKQASIQDTIDKNKRSPYYQPSGVGTAPYASSSDYSQQGQKQAYDKMQQLKNQLRL